jgi:hypothetical protein
MKLRNFGLVVAMLMLLPLAGATNFEISIDDVQGDVNNPDVDIVKAWTSVEGSYLVFHVKVAGKINEAYAYTFTAYTGGVNKAGVIFQSGTAYYTGDSSGGIAEYTIDGDTLSIKVPYGVFSSWGDFSFSVITNDNAGTIDYAFPSDFDGGNDTDTGDNTTETDPAKETPTDTTISVKITNVEYKFEKVDNGQKWYVKILIEGTTSGVDHVSLCYVIYYKDGTYDVTEWMKGPFEMQPGSFFGSEIIKFVFNSTEGNWNKWKLELEAKYPVTEPDYQWVEDEKEVDKVVIYARAFKDAAETKWNQAKYETKPTFTSNGAEYTISGGGTTEEKKGIPGFELTFVFAAIVAALLVTRRK